MMKPLLPSSTPVSEVTITEEPESVNNEDESIEIPSPVYATPDNSETGEVVSAPSVIATCQPCIVLGKNVDNGKDVIFDPITLIPKNC